MFWKGRVSWFLHFEAFLRQRPTVPIDYTLIAPKKPALIAGTNDAPGIARLLNEWFEVNPKCSTAVTVEWVLESLIHHDIWIVIKDIGGTIRGCICSSPCEAPYPGIDRYGIVDWFCVHPLWRSKGLGSSLLETLDYVTYQKGRRCHVFLKEGLPLPLPHIPVYATFLRCRRAGTPAITVMPLKNGIYPYMTKERVTGLPLVRVDLDTWSEDQLDTMLPPCIALTSSESSERDWKTDTLVSMYAFRWVAGKWFGSKPCGAIV